MRFDEGDLVVWDGAEPCHVGEVVVRYGDASETGPLIEYCVRFADPEDPTRERDFLLDSDLRPASPEDVQTYRRTAAQWRARLGGCGWWDDVPEPQGQV